MDVEEPAGDRFGGTWLILVRGSERSRGSGSMVCAGGSQCPVGQDQTAEKGNKDCQELWPLPGNGEPQTATAGCCLLQQPPGFVALPWPRALLSHAVSSLRLPCPFSSLARGQRQLPSPQVTREQEDAQTKNKRKPHKQNPKNLLHDHARRSRCPSCTPGSRKNLDKE